LTSPELTATPVRGRRLMGARPGGAGDGALLSVSSVMRSLD